MKNILKKNQLMITALAIMLAIAGYLQFAEDTRDGEKKSGALAVDSGKVITENYVSDAAGDGILSENVGDLLDLSEEDLLALRRENGTAQDTYLDVLSLDSDVDVVMEDYLEDGMDEILSPSSAIPESGEIPGEAIYTSAGAAILADAKLIKEQTRAKNKEMLLEIIGNEYLSDEQKQQAVNSMVEMTQIAEKEAAAEILLEAKGFSDVVVSITGSGVDVVVNAAALSDAQRAQIEDIVMRKTGISPENIIISTVVRE